jgi:hypothetical protein
VELIIMLLAPLPIGYFGTWQDTQDTNPQLAVMPQEHEATDGPASALSASLLKHFGTARARTLGQA